MTEVKRLLCGLLTGLVVMAGPAGCTSRPAGSGPTTAPAAPTVSMTDLATRSGGWPAGAGALQTATDVLEQSCMKAAGFAFPARPAVRLPVPEDESAAIGLTKRRTQGYGLAVRNDADAREPVNHSYEALSTVAKKRYQDADVGAGAPHTTVRLYGRATASVPTDGCVAESRARLAGDVKTWARLTYIPEQLDERLTQEAARDPRYLRALDAWRSCMTTHGLHYTSPTEAVTALRERYAKEGVTERLKRDEINVAVTDGSCATRTHLPTTLLHVRRAHVTQLPPTDRALLATLDHSNRVAVARAGVVLKRNR
ncbi:hypothetical protein [Streptomyces sp. NPDC051576]|uniref:hypothetical protein n=1 Tax=Streptomyces sp. NPDC051576 TaxID=3155803 RepID=UPI0034337062